MPQNPFDPTRDPVAVLEGTIPFAGITKDSQSQYPPVPAWPGTPADRGIVLDEVRPLAHGVTDARAPQPPAQPPEPQAPVQFAPRFDAPLLTPQGDGNAPSFVREVFPLLLAFLAGGKDPAAMAAGVAGFARGRRLKERERMDARVLQQKEDAERAEFYARALQNAGQIDDALTFEQWKTAIRPLADLHGIPLDAFQFNNAKQSERLKKEAAELLATLDRQYPDGQYTAEWQGRRVPRAELARIAGQAAFDVEGQPKAPYRVPTPRQEPAVGSFEDYVRRKFGDNPTDAQILQARKEYGQADDRAASAAANAFRPYQTFQATETLAKAWRTASEPVREMRRQYRLMETGLSRFRGDPARGVAPDKNGGAQAVLVTFQKILDPTSVVRESEYARTATGQSLLNRLVGYKERLEAGGAGLTDSEMAAMVETAKQFLAGAEESLKGDRRRIEASAREFQIKPELVFDDLLLGAPPDADKGWIDMGNGVRIREKKP